jgi:hypothetical protein
MESLANYYLIDIDKYLDGEYESTYSFIDINEIILPLPYQNKALELYKNLNKK